MELESKLKTFADLGAYSITNNKIILFVETKECCEKLKKLLKDEKREIEITEVFKKCEHKIISKKEYNDNEIKNQEIINTIKKLYEFSDDENEKNIFKQLLQNRNILI